MSTLINVLFRRIQPVSDAESCQYWWMWWWWWPWTQPWWWSWPQSPGETVVNPFHVVVELFATAADNNWISASTFHDYGDSQDFVQHSFGKTAARSNVDCQHCAPGNLRFLVLETKFPPLVKKQHRYFPNLIVWTEKCMKVIILSQNFKAFVQACAIVQCAWHNDSKLKERNPCPWHENYDYDQPACDG